MEQSTDFSVTLPDNTKLDLHVGLEIIKAYLTDQAPVLDLYDGTNPGPHDDVSPVDLLALNALNAFNRTPPMTPMAELWYRAGEIRPYVAVITKREISDLSELELKAEIPKIVRALGEIEKTKGYRSGGTRTAKLLHRLRPNIVPIWDVLIGEWYGGSVQSWSGYLHAVASDVRRRENLLFLKSIPIPSPYRLGILRRWDILLWKLRYDRRRSASV